MWFQWNLLWFHLKFFCFCMKFYRVFGCRYYSKKDLHKNYKDYLKYIGDNEVFLPANCNRDIIEIQNILSFCQVIPQEKYENLTSIPNNVFFYRFFWIKSLFFFIFIIYNRAKYDNFNKKLVPEPEKWPKYCVCEAPYCPDLAYIQCDICDKWFHYQCVGLDEEDAQDIEKFVCMLCQKKKTFVNNI